MEKLEMLPESSLFEADGHVTEVVLTCLADGEASLLSATAVAHVDACDACTERLGLAALCALDASEALQSIAREAVAEVPLPALAERRDAPALAPRVVVTAAEPAKASPARIARRAPPYAAIAAALVVAGIAAAPSAIAAAVALPKLLRTAVTLMRVALLLLRHPTGGFGALPLALNVGSALVLITIGSVLGRAASRSRSLEGGVG
jgi:hypothetical protein